MKIKVQNWYEDGWESTDILDIDDPAALPEDEEDLRDLLYEFTGDGHGTGNDLGLISEVTIVECAEYPHLVGFNQEYGG